jgi:hypothetical protein
LPIKKLQVVEEDANEEYGEESAYKPNLEEKKAK